MKKIICLLLAAAMLLSLCACKKKEELSYDVYSAPEDITLESIINLTSPTAMMMREGGVQIDIRNDDPFNAGADAYTISLRYLFDENMNTEVCRLIDYDGGLFMHYYFTTSDADPYMYYMDDSGAQCYNMTVEEMEEAIGGSAFGLDYYAPEITEFGTDANGDYIATIDCYTNDEDHIRECTITMYMDPASGYVSHADTLYYNTEGENVSATVTTVKYSKDIQIDKTPKEQAPAREEETTEEPAPLKSGTFTFATHDLDGNFVTYQDYADAKLLMLCYWDPRSVECLGQMPDLKVLYDDYKDQGLVIIGVLSDETVVEDAKAAIKEYALGFPTVLPDMHLSNYVATTLPTTYFVDADGNVTTEEPYVGEQTYEDWTEIVADLLEGGTEEAEEDAE